VGLKLLKEIDGVRRGLPMIRGFAVQMKGGLVTLGYPVELNPILI
jgi:hypothetical protein